MPDELIILQYLIIVSNSIHIINLIIGDIPIPNALITSLDLDPIFNAFDVDTDVVSFAPPKTIQVICLHWNRE
jgi:hypothetical protein